jgi:signal peptidase I
LKSGRPDIIFIALGSLLVFGLLGARFYMYQSFSIPSASMSPTLSIGDYIIVQRFMDRDTHPDRGDIVVSYSEPLKAYFVRRIVGLPGDRVQMVQGRVSINGKVFPQRRIADFMDECGDGPCAIPQYEERYPNGRVAHVLDADTYGPADNTGVYTVPPAHYFALGDHRDNSDDSRMSQGYVRQQDIIGRPVRKFIAGGGFAWQPIE